MDKIRKEIDRFLKGCGMHYDGIDLAECCEVFMDDMRKGLDGKESTLKMLPTYISLGGEIPAGEPVIVMDAGGTNLRVAAVTFDRGRQPLIEDFKSYPIPGSMGKISKDEFFAAMARYLAPVLNKSGRIGFCFSYPTEMMPSRDGRLIRFNKEVRVREMEGAEIGSNLVKALNDSGFKGEKKIVLLNDTVATLLGGKAAYPDRYFESYIGFILGTGTNTCYIEENRNIGKAPSLSGNGSTLINIESGGYGKAPRGKIDEIFDSKTADPGTQQLEKMISGAYQGGLLLEILKKAAEEGVFSGSFVSRLNKLENLTSREIDDFCFYPYSVNVLAKCVGTGNLETENTDRRKLYFIIDAMFERAARLTTVVLASVMLKTGKGKDPCMPVCITAEGTTFYKSKLFKTKLDYYVRQYMNDKMGIYCEFVRAENATLVGTAIAGLLN